MANEPVPVFDRQVTAKETDFPDFQQSTQAYAASANNLSALGAQVAQSASNQMATQLGYEEGKTPHGDLTPPITDFDKAFTDSYHTQANATLQVQGQKLLDDAHVEMSKPNRLTPGLIANTTQQLQLGLNKIADQAPTAIKGQLQATFDSQVLNQTMQYKEKMIGEQRDDQKNTMVNALDLNVKNALELAKNGDAKGAANLVNTSKQIADNAVANRFLTPEEARIAHENVVQASLNGQYINMAMQAQKDGKFAEFQSDYAKNKPAGMTNEQWLATGQAFTQQMDFLQSLQKQDQSLKMAKFNLAVVENPGAVTGQMVADLKSQVSPQDFVDEQIKLVRAQNKANKLNQASMALSGSMSNTDMFAGATEQQKNNAFDLSTQRYLQQAQSQGVPLSPPEAQLHIAMNAAGTIPKYVNQLKEQLSSTNPGDIAIAGESVEKMFESGNGQKLAGLGSEPVAMYEKFQALRTSMPDVEAAQKANEIVYGKTPEQKEANNQAWAENIKNKLGTNETKEHFFLTQAGISPDSIVRNSSAYARQMQNTYETYFKMLNGDDTTARKMLQKNVAQTYGDTFVNGQKEFTYLPIEKVLNLPENSVGVIQSDIANQLDTQFKQTKALYDAGRSDFYWEVRPKINASDVQAEVAKTKAQGYTGNSLMVQEKLHQFNTQNGVEVVRHWRGNQVEKYDTVLQANPYSTVTTNPSDPVSGGWEVMLKSDKGVKSIGILDPVAGITTYRPNVKKLRSDYAALNLSTGK